MTSLADTFFPLLAQVTTTDAGTGAGAGAWFAGTVGIILLLLAIAALILVVWAVIDAIMNPYLSTMQKLLFIVVIFFFPLIGAIIYFVLRPTSPVADAYRDRGDMAHA